MNNVDLDNLVKSETGFGAAFRGSKQEGREEKLHRCEQRSRAKRKADNLAETMTLLKRKDGGDMLTPEAIKKCQPEQARLEERRRRDVAEPPPFVNGVTLRRKSDLGCKLDTASSN